MSDLPTPEWRSLVAAKIGEVVEMGLMSDERLTELEIEADQLLAAESARRDQAEAAHPRT
jgi:hypothetical protein